MKQNMTLSDIRLCGNQALFDKLGPVGFVRFMQQFVSRGDYTRDRANWIGKVDLSDIEARASQPSSKRKK